MSGERRAEYVDPAGGAAAAHEMTMTTTTTTDLRVLSREREAGLLVIEAVMLGVKTAGFVLQILRSIYNANHATEYTAFWIILTVLTGISGVTWAIWAVEWQYGMEQMCRGTCGTAKKEEPGRTRIMCCKNVRRKNLVMLFAFNDAVGLHLSGIYAIQALVIVVSPLVDVFPQIDLILTLNVIIFIVGVLKLSILPALAPPLKR